MYYKRLYARIAEMTVRSWKQHYLIFRNRKSQTKSALKKDAIIITNTSSIITQPPPRGTTKKIISRKNKKDYKNMEATKTKNLITEAISAEKESAKKNWGSTYHSKHEAWAVLKEEVEESEFETEYVKTLLQKAWGYIRHDEFTVEGHKQVVQSIKDHALNLALEAVQIAAVAQKYIDTLEEVK